jgi:endo-1,4-beta-D-glucanase Y
LSRWRITGIGATSLMLIVTILIGQQSIAANQTNFTADRTTPQVDAAQWIVRNVPNNSTIIMDSYPWVDFRDPTFTRGKTLVAHYYWPALSDPQIRDKLLHDDWHNIDYLLISPNTTADAARSSLPLLSEAIQNSDEVATYASGNWNVKIMRVRKLEKISTATDPLLQSSWATYRSTFIENGRVVDPQSNNRTTSPQQADAMLQAVYVGDRGTFDQLWDWTQANLERSDDHLFASQWGLSGNNSTTPGVIESNTSANADETIALSLLLASKKWSDPDLLAAGRELLRHIWNNETSVIANRRILVAGNWAGGGGPNNDNATVNPSYFMPSAYRIFADADSSHPWLNLVDSSYDVLESIHQSPNFGGPVGLYPDWVSLDMDTGNLHPATLNTPDVNQSARDAYRIAFNLAVDWLWSHDGRAMQALQTDVFAQQRLAQSQPLLSAYNFDGTSASSVESLSAVAATLPAVLLSGKQSTALKLYAQKILRGFDQSGGAPYWGSSPNDVRLQSSVWFTTAVMDGGFANLWAGDTEINWTSAFYR